MKFQREDTTMIKGLAIMLMLYHHLFAFPDRLREGVSYISLNITYADTAHIIGVFEKICVALFAFLAGYGIYYSCKKNSITYIYKKRVWTLCKIYWITLVIFVPLCAILHVPNFLTDPLTLIKNFLVVSFSYNGEAWFLQPYIILILLSPFIFRLNTKVKTGLWVDGILIILINLFCNRAEPLVYMLSLKVPSIVAIALNITQRFFLIAPEFLLGYFCAKHDILSKAKTWLSGKLYRQIIALLLLPLAFILRHQFGGNWDCVYALLITVGSVVVFNTPFTKWAYKLLHLIGEQSTIIWLTHSFFCYKLCQRFIFAPKISVLVATLLLIVSYITSLLINKGIALWHSGIEKIRDKQKVPSV